MAVRHGVTDSDKRFVIDPLTRTITNQSGKLVLIQYDHNSEQFTFECPRFVDGHDMTLCNKVEVHYINTGTGNARSTGIFEADIPVVSEDNPNAVAFTWLVSNNATQYVGKLNFVIRFSCVGDEGVVEYAWNTGIYSDIAIAPSIYNGEVFVEEYVDVLEQWKQDLYSEGLKIASVEQTTTSTEDSGINVITMTMTDGSIKTFEVRNGSPARSIDQVAPMHVEHTPGEFDRYEILFSDGTSFPIQIYNGSDGAGIMEIMLEDGNGLPGETDRYAIHMTDGRIHRFNVYNGHDGGPGEPGESEFISSITRTGGDGSSGSIDTYTIRTSRNKSYTFKVYNGKDGSGSGSGSVTVDSSLSKTSTNPVQNKVVATALDTKQTEMIGVNVLETICENVTFNNNNPKYTLPSAVALDSNAFYYMDCYYYEGNTSQPIHEGYSIHEFSKVSGSVVRWGSQYNGTSIFFDGSTVKNNWRSSGDTCIISIYKVEITYLDRMLSAAMRSEGYGSIASGGYYPHAEGYETIASGYAAHSEGGHTVASGDYSHTQGHYSRAEGKGSSAEGIDTLAGSYAQHVEGAYNIADYNDEYLHIVGNGTVDNRSNAHTLDWEGNAWFAGNVMGKQANVTEQLEANNGINKISIWPNGIAGDPKEGIDESKLWIGSDGHGYFTNLYICAGDAEKQVATTDDIAAAITGAIEGSY